MKTTTIRKVIAKKLDEWLETIDDLKLRVDVRKGLIVSGGSIASMLMGEPVNDYDIYLSDQDLVYRVANYYVDRYAGGIVRVLDGRFRDSYLSDNPTGGELISIQNLKQDQIKLCVEHGGGFATQGLLKEGAKYVPLFFSPNAITLSDDIQIVLRFHGSPDKVHETFDFVHATNYFCFEKGLVTNTLALECLLTKTLIYQGSKYPLTSVIRSKKFINRGFRISAGEYLKMMFQISMLNLTDLNVLEEQLIGVDVAYFNLLIQALRRNKESNQQLEITSAYINSLIDSIFSGALDETEKDE